MWQFHFPYNKGKQEAVDPFSLQQGQKRSSGPNTVTFMTAILVSLYCHSQ